MRKRLTADEIKSILFTGAALIVAMTVFFLSSSREQAVLPAETPAVTASAAPTQRPSGREETAFSDALSAAGLRVIDAPQNGTLYLRDPDRPGRVRLDYSVRDGCVHALTMTFPLPAPVPAGTYKPKWATPVPESVQRHDEKEKAALNDSLKTLITACIAVLDANGEIPSAVVLHWYDGAAAAKDADGEFEDDYAETSFAAATTWEGKDYALRISVILP